MDIIPQLDPELRSIVTSLPVLDLRDIGAARDTLRSIYAQTNTASTRESVVSEDYKVPGLDGEPSVIVRLFRPRDASGQIPCLIWTQGGGYVLTAPDFDDQFCSALVDLHHCAVASIDWRRAPEHPFPGALNDAYAALAWASDQSSDLGIDKGRIAIGGHSSGGGVTAALALMARDRNEYQVCHQLLIYPMVDASGDTASNQRITDERVWNCTSNRIGWANYLGEAYGGDEIPAYAAAARAEDLSGLADATVLVGELDPLLDEDVSYAQRLMQAGVSTELHVYRAAHHAFDRHAPTARITRRFNTDRDAALAHAFVA